MWILAADMLRWVQSTDTEYSINEQGPWAPQYKPNASETSHLVEDSEWGVRYGKHLPL